jgi:hypothetical protein
MQNYYNVSKNLVRTSLIVDHSPQSLQKGLFFVLLAVELFLQIDIKSNHRTDLLDLVVQPVVFGFRNVTVYHFK